MSRKDKIKKSNETSDYTYINHGNPGMELIGMINYWCRKIKRRENNENI